MSREDAAIPVVPGTFQPGLTKGITIRQLFAAMAMQGIAQAWKLRSGESPPTPEKLAEVIAQNAILQADALLAELEKRKEGDDAKD